MRSLIGIATNSARDVKMKRGCDNVEGDQAEEDSIEDAEAKRRKVTFATYLKTSILIRL